MGQGSQKFAVWHKEIYKQAKRCDWSNLGMDDAARDAVLYHTIDYKPRKRILANNMSYQETLAWGQSQKESAGGGHHGQVIAQGMKLEEKLSNLQVRQRATLTCQTCATPRHTPK